MTDKIVLWLANKLRAERPEEFDEYVAFERKMLETEIDDWDNVDRERWIKLNDHLFNFIMSETRSDNGREISKLKLDIRGFIRSEVLNSKD